MWVTIEKSANTVAIVEAKLRLLARWLEESREPNPVGQFEFSPGEIDKVTAILGALATLLRRSIDDS